MVWNENDHPRNQHNGQWVDKTSMAGDGDLDDDPGLMDDGRSGQRASMITQLMSRRLLTDPDLTGVEPWAYQRLTGLLDGAMIRRGNQPDDSPLLAAALQYDPQGPAGSHADYLATVATHAMDGYEIHVADRPGLEQVVRENVLATSLDPNREFARLGLPAATPSELAQRNDDGEPARQSGWMSDEQTRRRAAANRAADTRRDRVETAMTQHLAPLNPGMRTLFDRNVDRGLIHGSAWEDRMAFADALTELQHSGWNPQQGAEYRKSNEFKRLERELLAGRKPTRRYRQLRDALCDNETEYRRFMAANPDVFDPDEKVVKPFAGLGPDVGQNAMLRLTAQKRGIRDAVRLARRDPMIIHTVGDPKTHTFTVTRDQYPEDSTDRHHAVTANGIKPATVLPWIMGETPDMQPDPTAWEQRSRRRFEESMGGVWQSHDGIV